MSDWSNAINMAYTALSVVGILVAGAVWVMTIANKLSSKIAIIENNVSEFKHKLTFLEDSERKNESFRHKHSHDVKNLQTLVDLVREDIGQQRQDFSKQITELKTEIERQINGSQNLILAKLDLAIEKNKNDGKN